MKHLTKPIVAFALIHIISAAHGANTMQPSYETARAFAVELMKVVDEGPMTLGNVARTREINGLEARAEGLFKKPGIGKPFRTCVDAALFAREYRQTQVSAFAQTGRPLDAIAINEIARAGYRFGDLYRQCRVEIEALAAIR